MKRLRPTFTFNTTHEHKRIKRQIPQSLIPNNRMVPAIMHYVWLGTMLNKDQIIFFIENVLKKTTGFRIIFWVEQNVKNHLHNTMAEYTTFKNLGLSGSNTVEFKVIEECYHQLNVNHNYSAFLRESHGVYKNNPAASDILRYIILYQFGGIYLDMDVTASSAIEKNFIQSEYGFAVRLIDDDYDGIIHNFIIATSINHPWIKLMLDSIENNYYTKRTASIGDISPEGNETWDTKRSDLYYYNGKSKKAPYPVRHEKTVHLTGSGLLFNVLNNENLIPYVGELISLFQKRPPTLLSWRNTNTLIRRRSSLHN